MKTSALDLLLSRLQRVGQAGALPKNLSVPQLIDELQRQLSALADANRTLLTALRAGPMYDKDSNLFFIDARTAASTFNILTTAQAAAEGLGTTAGLAIFRHGLGYKLDRYVQVDQSGTPTVGAVNGQDKDNGTVWRYACDEQRTVFQIDQDAQTNQSVFVVACYSSRVVPSVSVNPDTSQKTGAATPQLGLLRANLQTELP